MNVRTVGTVLVVLMLLAIVTTPLLAAPTYDDDEIELEGAIDVIDLAAGTIVVDGTIITVDDDTIILTGKGRGTPTTLGDLEVGQWVCVSGTVQTDGSVLATRMKAKPMPGDPAEAGMHPVAERLAELYGLDYDDIITMHDGGIGFGPIRKSYRLATDQPESGLTGEELLQMRLDGMGWGGIRTETGVHPGQGRPSWAGGTQPDTDGEPANDLPGNGNSNGHSNGRGNANGHSKK